MSDETLERIRTLGDAMLERSKALQEDLREARNALSDSFVHEPPDEASVMAAAEALGAAELALRKNRLRYDLEVQKLLTPEQRAAVTGYREGRGERARAGSGSKRMRPAAGPGPGRAKGKGPGDAVAPGDEAKQGAGDAKETMDESSD